jgi:hypothetical protein
LSAEITLWEAFAEVPDPRDASGRRHPLQAMLTLASVAILGGAKSLTAIAQFGRDRGEEFQRALGFTRDNTPCCATFHYLFRRLDLASFERAIRRWLDGRCRSGVHTISMDGKTARGTQGYEVPGLHLLAAYAHEAKAVMAQIPVDAKTNEHKAALQLLKLIPLEGVLVTGDAMFCQRDLSRKISERKGDWLWTVKDNQPDLRASIASAFDDADFSPLGEGGRGGRTADGSNHR